MDIMKASNTPTMVKKIIGNGTFLSNIPSTFDNQIAILNKTSSVYNNNSTITISNIEISYTDLGLLNIPVISFNQENPQITFENLSNFTTASINNSILEDNTSLKSLYDETILYKNKSSDSKDDITKETYILLSIQSLVNLLNSICNFVLLNDDIKQLEQSNSFYNIILDICNSLHSSSNVVKLLSALIGQETFSFNYANRIQNELSYSLSYLSSAYNTMENNNTYSAIIKSFINSNTRFKISEKNSIELFLTFYDFLLQILETNDLLIQLLLSLSSYSSDIKSSTILKGLEKIIKIATYITNIVYFSYKNINDNYVNIIDQIQNSINNIDSLSLKTNSIQLIKILDNSFLVSNNLRNDTNKNLKSSKTNNFDYLKDISISNINSNFDITFSFYIFNLNINLSGTIGSKNFTGYLSYPGLYNLNYFGINDVEITTEINLPSNINTFNIKQCLNPELKITNIVPNSVYNTDTPNNFNVNITFSFSVNGEIISSTVLPIVIAK